MKKCGTCKTEKEASAFSSNKARKDGLQSSCRVCRKNYQDNWYKNNQQLHISRVQKTKAIRLDTSREFIFQYLLEHPCTDCGECDPVVLDFDHLRDKSFDVTRMLDMSMVKIKKEIEKCVVRCANCHRRKTAREKRFYRFVAGECNGSTLAS